MSVSTRLTQLLRIKHPILLAPMDLVSDGRLAAAVTRAGGFGMIGGGYGDEKWLAREMDAAGQRAPLVFNCPKVLRWLFIRDGYRRGEVYRLMAEQEVRIWDLEYE
jgi:NAD(P)H-dependent flavin oxidoreductase YrpB (nitropropane dioxygenase family)